MHKTKKIRLGNKSALVTVLFVSGMGLIFVYVTLIYSSVVRFCWDVLRLIAQQPQKEDGLLISKFIGIGPAYVGGVDINRWIDAAFSIPEASGSQKIPPIGGFLNLLILFGFLCFVIYLVLVLQDTKREIREKQKRLKMLGYIYEVETLLFSTCLQDRSHCVQALERIAKMAGAQGAFLKLFVKTGADQVYVWCPEPEQERVFSAILEKNRFFVGAALNGMIRYDKQEATEASISTRRRSLLSDANLSNFAEVVVKDAQGECIGMLGVFNAESKNPDMRAALENVTHSFGIWYENLKRFEQAKVMREMDFLTGLYNRNQYQNNLWRYKACLGKAVACIYLDANALHVLNNRYGHEAGDRMLRTIAKTLCAVFCREDVYRIGGDEFIVFIIGEAEHTVLSKLKYAELELAKKGYSVSAGMQWVASLDSPKTIESLLKKAEQKMYTHKKRYYAERGKICRNLWEREGVQQSEYKYADAESSSPIQSFHA